MARWIWLLVGLSCLVAAALLAEPAIVVTRDGQSYEGDVNEQGDSIHITNHGITTVIPKSNVAEIKYRGDYDAEFAARLAKLDASDGAGRIALAREAFDQRKYELSRAALEEALKIDPNNKEAYDMLDLVLSQLRLERGRDKARPADGASTGARSPATGQSASSDRRLLSPEDINIIRQQELKPADTGVRIMFQGDVKRNYAASRNMTFAEFNRLPPVQQALAIIESGSEEMRKQVRIASDPSSMTDYKRHVHPLVISGCATSACHGGPGGGGLLLFSPAETDPLAYTNFYILQRYSKEVDRAIPPLGPAVHRLIDRGHGEDSLLANFGLPTSIAQLDHPLVGNRPVQAVFRNKDDPRYQQLLRWMNESLKQIEPNFQIDYTIPAAATRPASTQP